MTKTLSTPTYCDFHFSLFHDFCVLRFFPSFLDFRFSHFPFIDRQIPGQLGIFPTSEATDRPHENKRDSYQAKTKSKRKGRHETKQGGSHVPFLNFVQLSGRQFCLFSFFFRKKRDDKPDSISSFHRCARPRIEDARDVCGVQAFANIESPPAPPFRTAQFRLYHSAVNGSASTSTSFTERLRNDINFGSYRGIRSRETDFC